MLLLLLPLLLSLTCQPSHSATIIVDGVSEWKNPTVYIGDAIIFRHNHYNLYIFQNQRAFDLCNFSQATLLTKPDSLSFEWHPSRKGFFFFTFHNGSLSSCNEHSQKLPIKVSPARPPPPPPLAFPSPLESPLPGPRSGGVIPSSPAFPWPFHPREAAASSSSCSSYSPAPMPSVGANSPMSLVPGKVGGGGENSNNIPFINSNPAVPLPTGEVDSATIRPMPMNSASGHPSQAEVGKIGILTTLLCVVSFLLPLTEIIGLQNEQMIWLLG